MTEDPQMIGCKLVRPSDTPPIPEPRIFMMGSGKPVQPRFTRGFCRALVEKCLDDEVQQRHDFVLGFAACFDAVARGTIDMEEHPVNVALQAYADVHSISSAPNKVTNIMRIEGEK